MQKLHENKKSNFITENQTADSNRLMSLTEERHVGVGSTASTSHAFQLSRDELPDTLNNGSGGYEVPGGGTTSSSAGADKPNDDNMLENDAEPALRKRMFVLRELVATEESYVKDLAMIVDGYIREIRDPDSDIVMPEDLRGGKERMIFGNVEAIYEWHREYVLG